MNNNPNQAGGQQDYVDKAFSAGAKKFGGAQGQKIAGDRAKSEKIVRPTARGNRLFLSSSFGNVVLTTRYRPTVCARSMRN
jgi:hypothetical protein